MYWPSAIWNQSNLVKGNFGDDDWVRLMTGLDWKNLSSSACQRNTVVALLPPVQWNKRTYWERLRLCKGCGRHNLQQPFNHFNCLSVLHPGRNYNPGHKSYKLKPCFDESWERAFTSVNTRDWLLPRDSPISCSSMEASSFTFLMKSFYWCIKAGIKKKKKYKGVCTMFMVTMKKLSKPCFVGTGLY